MNGSLFGLVAIVGLLRDKDIAVYVFANLDHAELRHAIMYKAIDLYAFDDDGRDWHKEIYDLYSGLKKEANATPLPFRDELLRLALYSKT